MRLRSFKAPALALFVGVAVAACSSTTRPSSDSTGTSGAALDDAGAGFDAADANVDKSATCVSQFGGAIGSVGFARFDGTVVAVVPPGDEACPLPNSTHLILELAMQGAVYRMVINVSDDAATGAIHMAAVDHAAIGDAWSDGWHPMSLDYVTTLGLHTSDFATTPTAAAVQAVTDAMALGAHVSVFATAAGEANSAHLVHRNATNADGAIVVNVDPGGAPKWLLFSFANQSF